VTFNLAADPHPSVHSWPTDNIQTASSHSRKHSSHP